MIKQIQVIKKVLNFSKRYFYLTIIIKLLNILNTYLILYISRYSVNILTYVIIQNGDDIQKLIMVLLICGVIELLTIFVFNILQYQLGKVKLQFDDNVSLELINKVSSLDMSYYDQPQYYNQISQARKYRTVLIDNFNGIIDLVFSVFSFVVAFVVSMQFNIYISIFAMVVIVPSIICHRKLINSQFVIEKDMMTQQRFTDYLIGLFYNRNVEMEMQLYNFRDYLIGKIKHQQEDIRNTRVSFSRKKASFEGAILVFEKFANIFQMIIVIIIVLRNNLMFGDYTYYSGILGQLTNSTKTILHQINNIHLNNNKYDEYLKIINLEPQVKNRGHLQIDTHNIKTIEFNHVYFKYPNSSVFALKDVSFKLNISETLAIIGENGSGKSTLVKLLMRYYEPTEGSILLNDIDIREYDIVNYRELFSAMFQEPVSYMLTMRENIQISDISRTNGCNMIDGLLTELNMGNEQINLDNYYGKEFFTNGYVLSKGQQQKIHAARMLYHPGLIYVLDEPAASMDVISETKFLKILEKNTVGKSVVYITHRYNNLKQMNKILLLKNGSIVEEGTHDELMNMVGIYYHMYHLQEKNYEKNGSC